jgi:hypothetical protein
LPLLYSWQAHYYLQAHSAGLIFLITIAGVPHSKTVFYLDLDIKNKTKIRLGYAMP